MADENLIYQQTEKKRGVYYQYIGQYSTFQPNCDVKSPLPSDPSGPVGLCPVRHFSIQMSGKQLKWKVKKENCSVSATLQDHCFLTHLCLDIGRLVYLWKGKDHVQGFPICGTLVNYQSYTPRWILWCWINCDLFCGCSLHGEHLEGFALPLGHTFHWTCVLSDRAEGSQWIQNLQRRDLEGHRGTPTCTQHECLHLISSESSERKLS